MKALLFISLITLATLTPISWATAVRADDDSPMTAMWGSNIKDTSAADEAAARKQKEAQDAADKAAADRAAAAAASSSDSQ